jgi:tetratricopeptide (TPR) repeat protein
MLNFVYASSRREEPLPYGRLALQAYVELGNLPRQGHCLNNLAMQEYTRGRWDESLGHLRQAADIFRRIGDTAAEANALFNQVELLVRQGRVEDAGAVLPGVLRIARAVEDDELVGLALREQARTSAQLGDLSTAMALLDQTRALFVDLHDPAETRTTEATRAELLLDAGSVTAAARVLASVSDAGEPPDATMSRLLGRSHLAAGRLAEARVVLEAGIDLAERDVNSYEEGLLLLALSELTEREGGSGEATARRARELLESLGVQELPGDDQPTLPRMSLGKSR